MSDTMDPSTHEELQDNRSSPDAPEGRQSSARTRKRTKTGCLTCRKRRIKCGEERPICANCVKSKRNCEGYAPRLTFKDPMSAYAQAWPMRGYPAHPGAVPYVQQHMEPAAGHPHFPLIAPRPLPEQSYPDASYGPQVANSGMSNMNSNGQMTAGYQQISQQYDEQLMNAYQHGAAINSMNDPNNGTPTGVAPRLQGTNPIYWPQSRHATSGLQENVPSLLSGMQHPSAAYAAGRGSHPGVYEPRLPETTVFPPSYPPHAPDAMGSFQSLPPDWHEKEPPPYRPVPMHPEHPAMAQLNEDDEYYDVDSDEEMPEAEPESITTNQKKQRDLSFVLALSGQGRQQNLRSVEAFLHQPNILATYAPRFSTSPLMDEATARIFCHFVAATGPLMSAYGRHPVNPALLFSGTPVPKSQQALWTYTIPMMAISNQALLHAVLAVASLNIARLQQAPLTVPIKHYQFALRRVAKAVATPGRRTAMATVAATILLSQFEILSAEHSKWHSHLAGARQLLTEIDFARWTDRIHEQRVRRIAASGTCSNIPNADLPWIPEPGSEDEKLINNLIGTSTRKDFHGNTQNRKPSYSKMPVTEKDMDDFQTYRDLFWMYTKIDNIQSFVSGRRLLLPFDRWIHCPPRAPMNRLDAVYGTLDHVALLLGRVADFAGKDSIRKRKALKANGGIWRPSPGMFGTPGAGPMSHGQSPPVNMPPTAGPSQSASPGGGQGIPQTNSSTREYNGMLAPSVPTPSSFGTQTPPSQTGAAHPPGISIPTPSNSGSMPSTPGQGLPTSQGPQSAGARPTNPMAGAPTFSGLLPDSGQTMNMPAAFSQAPKDILFHPPASEENLELKEATKAAEAEWNSIQEAFQTFENALGPAFSPLPADAGPVIDSPFGPALQYRTFQIAVGWLLFYMARIIAIRTHPAMPPASMMAAGISAAKTAQYCNMIGRINCGMQTPAPHQPLNPVYGGAITEMMLPLFVAGVQYMDNAQRHATIERLQFVADRIGHDSAALIAAGLEKTWIKMHEAGRGPPYIPSVRVQDEYGRDLTSQQRNMPGGNGDIRVPRGPAIDLSGKATAKSHSRGAVILQKDTRSYAAGIMGLEENFSNLNVDE